MDKKSFAARLKEVRYRMGLTQRELSERAGVSVTSYSAYEQGQKTPPLTIAFKLAKVLNVSLDWLCDLDGIQFMVTYADVAKALREIDKTMGFGMIVFDHAGDNPFGDDEYTCNITIYNDATESPEDAINSLDGEYSDNFRKFLLAWQKMRPLEKDGSISSQILEPWFKEQYALLNVLLPWFRTDVGAFSLRGVEEESEGLGINEEKDTGEK